MLKTVHQFGYLPYINIYRTVPYTPAAPRTLDPIVIFVHVVFELVHEPLTDSLKLLGPGIMTRSVKSEQGEHAGIPIADTVPLLSKHFVLDIKAPASGAEEGAGTAVETGKGRLFPKRGIKKLVNDLIL